MAIFFFFCIASPVLYIRRKSGAPAQAIGVLTKVATLQLSKPARRRSFPVSLRHLCMYLIAIIELALDMGSRRKTSNDKKGIRVEIYGRVVLNLPPSPSENHMPFSSGHSASEL